MSDIYRQHEAAFSNVSAYVITAKGERVATVAFKYPRDGAGRLYAYVNWFGVEMVRGWAAGEGYAKHSAACATRALKFYEPSELSKRVRHGGRVTERLGSKRRYQWLG